MADHVVWGNVDDSEDRDDTSGRDSRLVDVEFRDMSSSEGGQGSHNYPGTLGTRGAQDAYPYSPARGMISDMHVIEEPEASPEDGEGDEDLGEGHEPSTPVEKVLATAGFWSRGSANHEKRCKPCQYVYRSVGCSNGQDCPFCHLPHTDNSRNRVGMSKRHYCKTFASKLKEACQGEPELFREVLRQVSSKSSYLHTILQEPLPEKDNDTPREPGSMQILGEGSSPTSGQPWPRPSYKLSL